MKYVLSIDGGGIRGLIPALVLADLEKKTGKRTHQLFDLICGTSTGGIIALGVTVDDGAGEARFSALQISKIYEDRGRDIFSRSVWKGVSTAGGLSDEKYSAQGLETVLDEYLSDQLMGAGLKPTLIPSYDIQGRTPLFFKSWHGEHQGLEMRHVARATSAAPTYFEPALVAVDGAMRALVDGGVYINNPAVSAYVEAKKLFPGEEIKLLSLGTGELVRPIAYEEARGWGKLEWAQPVMGCIFDGVSDAADYQMTELLEGNYLRLQYALEHASDDLDNATQGNIENLKSVARKLLRTHKAEIEGFFE
ncbi:patatin-like phospholipase family protein [Amphritea sp. HPY]|uniref:patatin-like phospholipase family protein n=1 Tax=Amphritea sp. HPY TaxID=3421652 RepID=UPI003D7DB7B2